MTDQTKSNPDAELTQQVTTLLTSLPDEIHRAEIELLNLEFDLRNSKAEQADAELNAQVNCDTSALKNAEARKLALDKAVLDDPSTQAARTKAVGLESMKLGAEANFNDLLRRYRAALALVELQAAKIHYRTAFQTKGK